MKARLKNKQKLRVTLAHKQNTHFNVPFTIVFIATGPLIILFVSSTRNTWVGCKWREKGFEVMVEQFLCKGHRGMDFGLLPRQSRHLNLIQIMSRVILIASDQGKFEVEEAVAKKSQLLKNMIEDTGVDEEIYLPNVKSTPLRKIIEFSEHYKNNDPPEIEKPLSKNSLKDLVDPWDEQFINLPNQQELLELLLAANYLDIKSLIELCCAKVATMIKGKSAEEIRQQFGIVNDFTPEEEAQIREENKWAEECAN